MSNKLPYVQVKAIFEEYMNATMFNNESQMLHGWSKDEFFDSFTKEFVAELEEESYNFTIEAPSTLH